jgi:hypothetical protein
MDLVLQREQELEAGTSGRLSSGGLFFAYTLEDPVRTAAKIPGETAIPAGTYRVSLRWSQRFQRVMMAIEDVPGFTGILIHGGNTTADTAGCPLLGMTRPGVLQVAHCADAVDGLQRSIGLTLGHGEAVWITVREATDKERAYPAPRDRASGLDQGRRLGD